MSKLLLNEQPLLVMPQLAVKIGLNESLILQQIHYWLQINEKAKVNSYEDHYWTYNTYEQWKEQFPFWSISTIQRTIKNLTKMKLLVVDNYNKSKIDRTKWYRIDYNVLQALETSPFGQIDMSNMSKWHEHLVNLNRTIPETSPETSPEKKHICAENKEDNKKETKDNTDFIKDVIDYLNKKVDGRYKPTTKETVKKINILLKDEYTLEDFMAVIDKKYNEWLGTKWEEFLTPDTLFAQKNFEKYLNQKINKGGAANGKGDEYKFGSVRSVQRGSNDSNNEERDIDF